MTEVFSTFITIARPMCEGDPGKIQEGHYTVADTVVTLTNADGKPIVSGRMQVGYTAKIEAGENQAQVASRLLWRHFRATKAGSDFNRPLHYRQIGIV